MIFELQIRIQTPWLGDIRTHENIRRFRRYRNTSDLEPDPLLWRWALRQAAESLQIDIHADTICVPAWIRSPSLRRYERSFRKGGVGKERVEYFECIDKGAVITLYLQVHSDLHGQPNAKPPTRLQLQQLFKFIGTFIGLSPFGRQFDYGRFDVLSVKAISEANELPPDIHYR